MLGVESSGGGPFGGMGGYEPQRDEDEEREWQALAHLWREIPEPEWDEDRAERVFQNIMATLERRERRRRFAWRAAVTVVPFALAAKSEAIGTGFRHLARRLGWR